MKYSLRSLTRFSIRDLALITVIVALAVGWWLEHRVHVQESKRLRTYDTWRNEFHATFDTPPWLAPDSSPPTPNPPKP